MTNYFVSYSYVENDVLLNGNCTFNSNTQIKGRKELDIIRDKILSETKNNQIIILNIQKLPI